MAPRQEPIPDSYIRRCVTKDGKTRWNARHYDPTTRRTVTLGTFAALAEAKAAYRARENGGAARDAAGAAAAPGAKTARAPKPSAARAPKPSAAPAPAPRAKKKGEKRKKPASASAAPPPPRRRRRRSSAETAATTAIVVASPARAPARTPRDSARMRNLADAALLAAKASVQKRLPPKKRALDDENASDSAGQVGDASPVSSVSAGTTPRLASPRRRRRSLILAPSFSPPTRAAARERAQALCDAAAVANDEDGKDGRAAKSSSSSSHGTRRRARSRRSVLGGIARRLSDGLLGVLSRAGRPAQLRGGQTLVPAEGPGWRWSAGGEDGALKSQAARPRATAEAVDVSVGDFRAAMAAAGVVVQHRVRLSLTAAGEEEEEEEEE